MTMPTSPSAAVHAPQILESLDPAIAAHVCNVFAATPFMNALGVHVMVVAPGRVETAMTVLPEHRQQHGLVHAGVMASLADHTAGACASTAAPGIDVLSIEFKVNMLAPAQHGELYCIAQTLRAGRRVSVIEADVFSIVPGTVATVADRVVRATVTLSVRARG